MAQLNMNVDDSVEACLDAFKASGGILLFNLAIGNETLQAQHFQKDISQVEKKCCVYKQVSWFCQQVLTLLGDDPRFILLQEGSAIVLVYYCPENADRRLKMTYSTFKRNVVELLSSEDVVVSHSMHCTESKEISAAAIRREVAPAPQDDDNAFAKPARRGRGNARMRHKK